MENPSAGCAFTEPLRILFLGAASSCHTTRWVSFLRNRGHQVLLATLHREPTGTFPDTYPLGGQHGGAGPLSPATLPGAVRRLRRLARGFRPDLTVGYYLTSYGLLARLAGLRPTVGVAAGGDVLVDPFDGPLHRLRNRILSGLALGGCSRALVWAPHVAARLEQLGFPGERIFVQPRGVNRSLFPFREPRHREPGEPLRILSNRWLKRLYRVDTLIDALVELDRRGVPFVAQIAGSGPEEASLKERAAGAGIGSKTTFIGRIEEAQVPEQLAWTDAYVSTSSSDGASSSLFEALSVGTFPVVSDLPANRFIAGEGDHVAFFPVGDHQTLAAHLERLALAPEVLAAGVRAARPIVENRLDFQTNLGRIEAFLCEAAREGKAKGQ